MIDSTMLPWQDMRWRLGVAFLVGALIGMERQRLPRLDASVLVHASPGQDVLPAVLQMIRSFGGSISKVSFGEETPSEGMVYEIAFSLPSGIDMRTVVTALESLPSIQHAGSGYGQGG